MVFRSLLVVFLFGCSQIKGDSQPSTPHVTLMSKEGQTITISRASAKNPLGSKLISEAFEDKEARELTVPIPVDTLRVIGAALQRLHEIITAHTNFSSLSADQQTKYVIEHLTVIDIRDQDLGHVLAAAHSLQAPLLTEFMSSLYATSLHQNLATATDRVTKDALTQDLRMKVAQHYFIQFNSPIAAKLGLEKKLSLPFSSLLAHGKVPSSLVTTIPGLDQNINACILERNESRSALSLLAASPGQASLMAARSLLCVENIDFNTPTKTPPIVTAAANGFTEMVELLVDAGASINSADSQGVTALMHAVRYGHIQTVKLLLERGAHVGTEAHGYWNWTALMMAAYYSKGPVYRPSFDEIIELLVQHGANAQHALAQATTRTAEERQRIEDALSSYATVQTLHAPVTVTQASSTSQAPTPVPPETFMIISKDGHKFPLARTVALATSSFFQKIIQRHPTQQEFSLSLPSSVVRTLVASLIQLHEAGTLVAGKPETISEKEVIAKLDTWLGKSVDTNTMDYIKGAQLIGAPILTEALSRKYATVLHKNPATIAQVVKKDRLPSDIGALVAKQYFLQFDEDIDHALGIKTHIQLATLLAYGKIPENLTTAFPKLQEDPNSLIEVRGVQFSPLSLVASHIEFGGLKTVKALLKLEHIDSNAPLTHAPLIQAAYHNKPEIVTALIAAGAKVNITDTKGLTPLMYAAHVGSVPAVKELLAHGSKVNVANKLGQTPLMYAASIGSSDVVQLLLGKGAQVNCAATATDFASPLMCAAHSGNDSTIKLLVSKGADVKQAINQFKVKGYDQLIAKLEPHSTVDKGKRK